MTARPVGHTERLRAKETGGASGSGAAIERLPLAAILDDIRSLWNVGSIFRTADGYEPVVVEAGEASAGLEDFSWPERPCLVLGNEATGVSPLLLDACDQRVALPMCGVKESFNGAVAFGIAAHHAATALAAANPGVVFRG